jgi:hypothetical protein
MEAPFRRRSRRSGLFRQASHLRPFYGRMPLMLGNKAQPAFPNLARPFLKRKLTTNFNIPLTIVSDG